MSARPQSAPVQDDADFEITRVNIADVAEEEWDDDLRQAVAEAEEDAKAGRLVPHALVSEWLSRVGTPDETPMPAEWLKR